MKDVQQVNSNPNMPPINDGSTNPGQQKTSKKRSSIVVILVIFLGVMVLCGICTASVFMGIGSSIMGSLNTFQSETFQPICEESKGLTEARYETLFTESYKSQYAYGIAVNDLAVAFPQSTDCSSLVVDGFIDMVMNGTSYSISVSSGESTIEYTYPSGVDHVTLYLVQTTGNWQIDGISY